MCLMFKELSDIRGIVYSITTRGKYPAMWTIDNNHKLPAIFENDDIAILHSESNLAPLSK